MIHTAVFPDLLSNEQDFQSTRAESHKSIIWLHANTLNNL